MRSEKYVNDCASETLDDSSVVFVEVPQTPESTTTITTSPVIKAAAGLISKNVKTPFGVGFVVEYREEDQIFVIKLTNQESFGTLAMLYTKTKPERYETKSEKIDALNVAYEDLEKMRRMNLEVMCHEIGIIETIDHEYCTTCFLLNKGGARSKFPRLQKLVDRAAEVDLENFPRLNRLFHSTSGDTEGDEETDKGNDETRAELGNGPTDESKSSPRHKKSRKHTVSPRTNQNVGDAVAETTQSEANLIARADASHVPGAALDGLLQNARGERGTPTPRSNPTSERFPRLKSLWGTIQNMPQPASAFAGPRNGNSLTRESTSEPSRLARTNDDHTAGSTTSFPRIRGFLEKSGASEMFDSMTATTTSSDANSSSGGTSFPRIRGVLSAASSSNIFSSISIGSNTESSAPTTLISQERSASNDEKPIALPLIQSLMDQRQKANTSACLICASPTCSLHSSSSFRREGITLCLQCERLFELEFIIDCVSEADPTERAKHIDHMIDCYDRCLLLLRYSSQFVEPIARSLESSKEMQNKIGLASSSFGALSGVLGIAAAASILSPVGPSLLIASLFFGGSATAVQTGTEATNYFSEPRKIADRILALHGMALSLLRVTSTLRDALLRDHIRIDAYAVEPTPLTDIVQEKIEKNRCAVLAGSNVGRSMALGGVAGVEAGAGTVAVGAASEIGATAGAASARSATAFSRAGTAAARTVRFARFAGGALSAAVLVMEANAIQSTLKSINEGSPCEKAQSLRSVAKAVEDFPTTSDLDGECQAYLEALVNRPLPPPEAEASAVPEDLPDVTIIPEATCQEVTVEYQFCASGSLVLDANATNLSASQQTEW